MHTANANTVTYKNIYTHQSMKVSHRILMLQSTTLVFDTGFIIFLNRKCALFQITLVPRVWQLSLKSQ